MAIGAAAGHIRRMVLRDGMLPVAIGMMVGLAASFAVNRILQSQLVGVSPYDPRYDGRRAGGLDPSRAARLPDSRTAGHEGRSGGRVAA